MADPIKFVVSRHARRRMRQRGVNMEQIGRALRFPDRTEADRDDLELEHALKRFHGRSGPNVLRVVYNATVLPVKIVTVFFEYPRRRR